MVGLLWLRLLFNTTSHPIWPFESKVSTVRSAVTAVTGPSHSGDLAFATTLSREGLFPGFLILDP